MKDFKIGQTVFFDTQNYKETQYAYGINSAMLRSASITIKEIADMRYRCLCDDGNIWSFRKENLYTSTKELPYISTFYTSEYGSKRVLLVYHNKIVLSEIGESLSKRMVNLILNKINKKRNIEFHYKNSYCLGYDNSNPRVFRFGCKTFFVRDLKRICKKFNKFNK